MFIRAKKLPPDIIDIIFDFAEYWAHSSNEIDFQAIHSRPVQVNGHSAKENKFLLRSIPVGFIHIHAQPDLSQTSMYSVEEAEVNLLRLEYGTRDFAKLVNYPTPKLLHPVRKVVFSIRGKLQGTGGESMEGQAFQTCWAWFEAGLERFDADPKCSRAYLRETEPKSSLFGTSSLSVGALRSLHPSVRPIAEANGKYRYSHPLFDQSDWVINFKKMVHRSWQDRVVTWSYMNDTASGLEASETHPTEQSGADEIANSWFVKKVKLGDVITVWAKARFARSMSFVEKVKVDIYWAIWHNLIAYLVGQ